MGMIVLHAWRKYSIYYSNISAGQAYFNLQADYMLNNFDRNLDSNASVILDTILYNQ